MMDLTDRHCRYFLRQLSTHLFLYTEMITSKAILYGNREALLNYHPSEHPIALQLGGSDPEELAQAAIHGAAWSYDEINLNVGCPSDRVQAGEFGLCLMKKPDHVAACVAALKQAVKVPISVKTRLGFDETEDYHYLCSFIEKLEEAGVDQVSIHARKGWLNGLSPKENRNIPPLRYDWVYRLKSDFPNLPIAINGGILNLQDAASHLNQVDSVMIGRAAYYDSYILSEIDTLFYGKSQPILSRLEVIQKMQSYFEVETEKGTHFPSMLRHLMGLYHGQANAKSWRRLTTDPHIQSLPAFQKALKNFLDSLYQSNV